MNQSLSDFLDSRSNNFNLIRFFAAFLVIYSHSYDLTGNGSGYLETLLRIPLSYLAVDAFFFTSGMLICKSFVERDNLIYFVMSRILRVFPALIALCILSVFVLGPLMSTIPLYEYINHPGTMSYLTNNINLFDGRIQYHLPGVFTEGIHITNNINGSLWTLPYEIHMYLSVMFVMPLLDLWKYVTKVAFLLATIILLNTLYMYHITFPAENLLPKDIVYYVKLASIFYTGVLCYVCKDKIKLHTSIFPVALVVLLLFQHIKIFSLLYPLTLGYCILYLAYIPKGFIRKFNTLGDYSYGIYIYAFPLQQLLVYAFDLKSGAELLISSTVICILASVLSWHLLEKHFLNLKSKFKLNSRLIVTR